jgi:hypothetical protein
MDAPPAENDIPAEDTDTAATDNSEQGYETWDELSWADVESSLQSSGYLDITTAPPPDEPGDYTWDSDAATLARITVQKPFRVAIHADDLLPDQPSDDG